MSALPAHVVEVTCDSGSLVLVCRRCGMPETFRGYAANDVRETVTKRHQGCVARLAPCERPAVPAPVAPVVVAAPVALAASAAPAAARTLALFDDEPPAPTKARAKPLYPAPVARDWSPLQQAIFADAREGTGHVRILARAGSGKSTTIVEALRHVPAGLSKCLLAFGKEAKEDLGRKAKGLAEVMTMHGLGYRAMTGGLGATFAQDKGRDLLKRAMPHSFAARRVVEKLTGLAKNRLAWGEEALIAIAYEFRLDPEPVAELVRVGPLGAMQALASAAQAQLDAALADTSRFDHDDMIWMPVKLGLSLQQYDRLFVDEAQDLNACQIAMLPRAIRPGGRIVAVGDDRQAIYAFRGADKDAFARLGRELNARTLPLTVSYRCPKAVARVAQNIVPDFEAAPSSPDGVVRYVTAIDQDELRPGDFVISRKNAPLVRLCLELLSANKPAIIQGKDVAGELCDLLDRGERATGATSLAALVKWIDSWHKEQAEMREARGDSTEDVDDLRDCLTQLLARCPSVVEVRDILGRACGNDREGDEKIVLTTAHKAKGLERDRVFVLESTFMTRPGVEEENLYYVAVTRAKHELVLVEGAS